MRLFLFSDLHNDEVAARRLAGEALGATPWETLAARDRRFIDRGSVQLRRWVEAHQPAAVLCGHVHVKEAVVDRIGETLVVNAGPHGWVGSFKAR